MSNYPTAHQMRKRTQKKTEEDVGTYLDHLFKKMEESGDTSLDLDEALQGSGLDGLCTSKLELLIRKLRGLDYYVTYYPDWSIHPGSTKGWYIIHW